MKKNEITIEPENNGQRLDKFLIEIRPEISRSQIQKLIKTGRILVENKPAKVHRFLKTGEKVSLIFEENKPKVEVKKISPVPADKTKDLLPKIIFETDDYLILEKPAGLLVHATEKNEKNTLVDWLLNYYPPIEKVGEDKYRAGIIHRLDKDVSGIMVVAKNNNAYFHLKDQFKERKVKKEYLALVYGRIKDFEGEIDLPIGRSKDGQFVAHPKKGSEKFQVEDRWAKTKYKVIEYIKDYSLLEVKILTGRTHQIRVHLSAIGHPILGDLIYKPKKKFFHLFSKKIKVIDLSRIFLHSIKIGFFDLNDNWQEFQSQVPDELKNFLDTLKK